MALQMEAYDVCHEFKPILTTTKHFEVERKECSPGSLHHAARRAWDALEGASAELDLLELRIRKDQHFADLQRMWKQLHRKIPEEVRPQIDHLNQGGQLFFCAGIEGGPYKEEELQKKLVARFTPERWRNSQKAAHQAMAYLPEHSLEERNCPTCQIIEALVLINENSDFFKALACTINGFVSVDLNKLAAFEVSLPIGMTVEAHANISAIVAPAKAALDRLREYMSAVVTDRADTRTRAKPAFHREPDPQLPTASPPPSFVILAGTETASRVPSEAVGSIPPGDVAVSNQDKQPKIERAPTIISHSSDFSEVIWLKKKYNFTTSLQRAVVKILFEEWSTTGHAISQATIGERLKNDKCRAGSSRFRIDHVFRNIREKTYHPAWQTMIRINKAKLYFLYPPKQITRESP